MLAAISCSVYKFGLALTLKLRIKTKDDSGVGKQMSDCSHQGPCKASTCYVTSHHFHRISSMVVFAKKLFGQLFTKQLQVCVEILVASEH